MLSARDEHARRRLQGIEQALRRRGSDLALFFVFDRPARVAERPGLSRTYFAQRCASDEQLRRIVESFRELGAYVELFAGEHELLEALANGRIQSIDRPLKLIYNGVEGGVGRDAFEPGRKAIIPAIADSYGLFASHSNAHVCGLGRHKFHYFTVLRALGIRTPRTWQYRLTGTWAAKQAPPVGVKVIAKSTYESWSVGVSDASVFVVDDTCEARVSQIAHEIGQSVTVQEFISGSEVCVPIFISPDHIVTPPIEAVLVKAPDDPDAITTVLDNLRHGEIVRRRFMGSQELIDELNAMASRTVDALELESFVRIDFRVDCAGHTWVTDVGISPGLGLDNSASHSLAELGFDHASLLRLGVASTLAARGVLD